MTFVRDSLFNWIWGYDESDSDSLAAKQSLFLKELADRYGSPLRIDTLPVPRRLAKRTTNLRISWWVRRA